jgi:hypothetical protein
MPCASITEGVDDMMALVKTTYDATLKTTYGFQDLIYDDVDITDRPVTTDGDGVIPWAATFIRHTGARQSAIAADGSARSRWERSGVLAIELHTPLGKGRTSMDLALQAMMDGLEGAATANGVWFRNVRPSEIGREGGWYKASVLADFEYDQIK